MSLLDDCAFMAHLEQSKVEAKQQVNSMIDAIYAKLLLDLKLWLDKHESKEANDFSVQQLGVNHNDATGEPIELMLPNTQMSIQQNVNCPPSLPPSNLQSHSNHFSIKSEIESDCEENVNEHNLPGDSKDCELTPPEPLQSTHSITPHSSSHSIVKEEIVDDEDYNFGNLVEVNSRVIQNEQSANDPAYLQAHNEFSLDTIPNNGISEFDEVSNRLSQNALTHQPRKYSQERMHFDEDLEIDQGTLDEVKREIEEEQEIKRRENKGEGGDIREDDEGEPTDIEQNGAIDTQESIGNSENGQLNFDESLVIQQNENDANNAIEVVIANKFIFDPNKPNLTQSNRRLQCPQCSKSFHHNSKLEQHVRMHTGERPFACDQCDKRFSQKCNLDSHLRTHSGERPFQCRFCELCFTELGTRRKHEQAKHHHVRPYRCKVCGLTATTRSTIIQHIRVVHFGLPQTLKEQRERNIIDERDPRDWLEKVEFSL